MKKTNNLLTPAEAISAAVKYADLAGNNPVCTSSLYRNGMYEITIYTNVMMYEFYVGGVSGEIHGMNAEPCLEKYDSYSIAA